MYVCVYRKWSTWLWAHWWVILCMCKSIFMNVYMYIYVYIHMYINIHIHTHTYTYTYTCINLHMNIHTHIHMHIHIRIHMHIHMHIHTCIQNLTHKVSAYWSIRLDECLSSSQHTGQCNCTNVYHHACICICYIIRHTYASAVVISSHWSVCLHKYIR